MKLQQLYSLMTSTSLQIRILAEALPPQAPILLIVLSSVMVSSGSTSDAASTFWLRCRLRQVPPDLIATLGRYAYLAELARLDAAHDFSADAGRYRGAVTVPLEQGIADAYDRTIETTSSNKGITSPNFATRHAAIASRNEAYDHAAPVTATLLASLIEIENRDASAQGYSNAAARK